MGKNSKPLLQFTKLTTDDIHKHRKTYFRILVENDISTITEKGKELCRAEQLFRNTFE